MARLDAYDIISIVGIPIYVVFLLCAVLLFLKHGFRNSSGWRYLVLLAVIRIVGFSMRLAIVNDPANVSLWIGWMVVNGLGLGPLVVMLLGVLNLVFDALGRQGRAVLTPTQQRLLRLLGLASVAVTAAGGSQSSFSIQGAAVHVDYSAASRAGAGLMIAIVVLLCLEALAALWNRRLLAPGEYRILLGVVASLPFVVVRLVYTCLSVFAGDNANVWTYLGMGILTEMIVVFVTAVSGLALDRTPPSQSKSDDPELLARRRAEQQSARPC
ncbi:uncharacterized protein MAM_01506 [Metarhizium album ARSEF 1941]|uniref:DUF7702 domain-containing protein n=1 Tax=Metarhizium album (strain ARSEF 1941) TaxID=1081103 RepID=A0A0B2X4Q2_METAS|nr:uncharacterized protein MAM_01506 [Metarhizium album ARSEF 1941]KHO00728.1 hypothetical protein MAM_01506 [Metarhizium album ARSEF 1941]